MVDKLIHKWLRVPYRLHMEVVQRPKKPAATVLLIHGIGSSSVIWQDIIPLLPDNVRIVTVDLLGFGRSPKPEGVIYDAKRQAQSVAYSFRRKGLRKPAVIVGHSLGSLVAVEIAKRHPKIARSLILCSPPFYKLTGGKKLLLRKEKVLLRIYKVIHNHPERFVSITALAAKYKLINSSYVLEDESILAYAGALEASIVNQTSLQDAMRLKLPITVIHGSLDPVVVRANLSYLVKQRPQTTLTHVRAGHEIKGKMIPLLVSKIDEHVHDT